MSRFIRPAAFRRAAFLAALVLLGVAAHQVMT